MPAPTAPSRPLRSRGRAAAAVAALLVVGLAACGDDSSDTVAAGSGDGATTTTAPAGDDGYGGDTTGGATDATHIEAKDFSLTSITVAPGAEVAVENGGAKPHTVTADDGGFDSGTVAPGTSGSITAPTEPGVYAFHCEIHSSMTGTLTVAG